MFTLKKVQVGDRIKLSRNGIIWIVWSHTRGVHLNPVIQLKSEKSGGFRTYSPESTRWNKQVWYV